ncbi:hypothetical protein CDN99_19225 [Roseateles aquatilis]|uniref:Phage shock protein PspC N-terminal domain-containing protein n=1 Tax=Roseateles aquatilis TaxID=431061 RepID=A0A246J2M7_9BURK|nr:PspC domain-containing protein [Roseateles aquatilis]OWQ86846.1 hypothetical protein CDN99_19225 [Roseateles aquatilis]
MFDSEELNRLADLHQRGILNDEEFARAKAKVLEGGATRTSSTSWTCGASSAMPPPSGAPAVSALNAFRRSRGDRWIGGVCGGLARISGLASWFWRIVFVALTMCAGGGMLLYLLLWIFVPLED